MSTQIDYDSVADIYDLYVMVDYDIPFFLKETANVDGPVLELTAGTGRLSLPLIQAGVQLTCVDRSRGMLDVLSRKLMDRGLSATLRLVGRFAAQDGTLVVSGFEQGGQPLVKRLQFFELFSSDESLRSRRLLPMECECVDKDHFEIMARDAGFQVVALYGNYDRSSFDADRSPVMIWVLQRADAQPSVAAAVPQAARR